MMECKAREKGENPVMGERQSIYVKKQQGCEAESLNGYHASPPEATNAAVTHWKACEWRASDVRQAREI